MAAKSLLDFKQTPRKMYPITANAKPMSFEQAEQVAWDQTRLLLSKDHGVAYAKSLVFEKLPKQYQEIARQIYMPYLESMLP